MTRLYLIVGCIAAVLLFFAYSQWDARKVGANNARVDHLTDTLKGKVANDAAINRAKNAGRDAVAADPDCLSDRYCRD